MIALGHGLGLTLSSGGLPGDTTPGGTEDVLLLAGGQRGLLLADGTGFLVLHS
ncbi:hypothetical protein [Prosthecobacter sp.]|uniref:hypothetical protein n=1 Tax=Prosthecobacter sp. TaxID=1965333 RepID=UPI0037851D8E